MSSLKLLHTVKISRAAELLLWSRNNQASVQRFPPDLMPRDLNEAYEIQLAVALLRPMPNAGFKLGLTNGDAQQHRAGRRRCAPVGPEYQVGRIFPHV
jgi:2-keto-4-pentenoate hydratase